MAGLAVPELANAYPYGGMFGMLPAWSLYARHVDGLSITNWRSRWEVADPRPAAVFDDVGDLRIVGFGAPAAHGSQPMVLLNDVHKAIIQGLSADQPAVSMVQTEGSRTRKIDIIGEPYRSLGAGRRSFIYPHKS